MITPEQRFELKKILRGNYIAEVKAALAKNNITTRNGNPYSDKMISHIFNGRYQNNFIEMAIMEVYINRKKFIQRDKDYKNKLLGLNNS